MKTFLKRSRFYVPAALRLPAKKLSYRFLLSLCLFFLILFSLALEYTGVSVFILLVIQVAFCADILVRCAWKDLLRGRCTFAVLVSMSVVAGFLYCALNTFLTRPLAGVLLNLHVQVSLLLTLALWAQYRMTHAQEKTKIFVKKLDDFLPKSGRLCTEKKTRMVFVNELKPGDRVLVHPGERVPCDGRIVEGATFLDEQLISGNIRSTAKQMGNTVYAGTLNKTQTICVEVETPLASSTIVSVLDAIKNNEDRHNQLPDALEKTAFWLVLLLAATAAIAYGYALVKQPEADWLHQTGILWLILALGCPVGWLFVAVFPTFFVHYGAKRIGIILNYFDTLQTFVQADTVFLDKTGTLTVGALQVDRVLPAEGTTETEVLEALVTAEQQVKDSFSEAVLSYAKKQHVSAQAVTSLEMVPGQGVWAQTEQGKILAGRRIWLEEKGIQFPPVQVGEKSVIFVARENRYLGYITLEDHLRQGAVETIAYLRQKGQEIIVISGDTQDSVQFVAREVGVEKFNFSVLPKTKAEIITNLRALGKKVVMVGDGFNDIIALLKADGGIVFGSGKNVYNHWVDIVIKRPDLCALSDLFTISKRLNQTIWGNMALAIVGQSIWVYLLLAKHVKCLYSWQALLGCSLGVVVIVLLNSMRLSKIK